MSGLSKIELIPGWDCYDWRNARTILQHGHPSEWQDIVDVLGAAQMMSGDVNSALGSYILLASLRPRSPEVLYRLGQMQVATGSSIAAGATFRKLLELQPDHPGGLAAMAALHLNAGRHHEALTWRPAFLHDLDGRRGSIPAPPAELFGP